MATTEATTEATLPFRFPTTINLTLSQATEKVPTIEDIVTNVKNVVGDFITSQTEQTTVQETFSSNSTTTGLEFNSTITEIFQNTSSTVVETTTESSTISTLQETAISDTVATTAETVFNTVTDAVTVVTSDKTIEGFSQEVEGATLYTVLGVIIAALVLILIILIVIYRRYKIKSTTSVYCVTDLNEVSVSSTRQGHVKGHDDAF